MHVARSLGAAGRGRVGPPWGPGIGGTGRGGYRPAPCAPPPRASNGAPPGGAGKVEVCIDLGFPTATPRELVSVAKQLSICYGLSRREPQLKLVFTSYGPEVARAVEEKFSGTFWSVERHTEPVWELYPPETLVYLSPDAGELLDDVTPGTVHVVGGIVDLAVESIRGPGSRGRAEDLGVASRRLPVREHLPGCTKPVLNVTTVVEALVARARGGEWADVIPAVVPRRHHQVSPRRRRPRRAP